jgi:hypothetical protein
MLLEIFSDTKIQHHQEKNNVIISIHYVLIRYIIGTSLYKNDNIILSVIFCPKKYVSNNIFK